MPDKFGLHCEAQFYENCRLFKVIYLSINMCFRCFVKLFSGRMLVFCRYRPFPKKYPIPLARNLSVSVCQKPRASEVLTSYLLQCNEPPWTSYFVKYKSVQDDQWGLSHFNWKAGSSNYHILRTGCYPYIKYHCSKRPHQDLSVENLFMRIIKISNLCIPCLMYGIAATQLIRHVEEVQMPHGPINIYFLYPEDKGSLY